MDKYNSLCCEVGLVPDEDDNEVAARTRSRLIDEPTNRVKRLSTRYVEGEKRPDCPASRN